MDPQENAIEYSQESQDLINQNDTLFQELQDQQREEAEAAAQEAAADAPSQEPEQSNVLGAISRDRTEEEDAGRVAGKGGEVRDIAGAVQSLTEGVDLEDRNFIQQASDAAAEFLGLRSEEESNEQRNEGIKQRQEDAETARQNNIVGSEAVRTVTGSVAGAAESTLETAEIIGDFTKTLASKANIVGYDPKDDPFSDQYSWASWNLGKDQLGAQTPAGKIAQGFGEFGVVFLASGGGSATANLFRGGVTGAGAVARTAGREALEGVLADVVMAASGEGNLSNLIKENAPDWYPTWLEALAIDEDDNPFEAAFKTAFEGGLLGAPVGVVTAYLKGARAVRKFQAENPKATQAELQQVAYEAIQGELNLGAAGKPAKPLEAHEVFMEMADGDFSRADQISADELRSLFRDYDLDAFTAESEILGKFPFDTTYEALGKGVIKTKLPNGSNISWIFSDAAGPANPAGKEFDAVRIDWDIDEVDAQAGGLGEGGAGTKMYSKVADAIKQADLKPGTIIQVEAAEDGFGLGGRSDAQKASRAKSYEERLEQAKKIFLETEEGATEDAWRVIGENERGRRLAQYASEGLIKQPQSIRSKLYQRAGFSPEDEDGAMWGIVKRERSGRKVFQPLDPQGDIEQQIFEATQFADKQLDISYRYHDKQALEMLEGLKAEGIPHTWDDVAAVVPDLFIPGTREVPDQFSDEALRVINSLDPTDPDAGATVHPFTGEVPTRGTMVAVDGASLDNLDDPDAIAGFIAKHYDVLSRDDVYLGSWVSQETGKPVVEISRLVENYDEAIALGKVFDQEGVFRLDDFHYQSTDGLDQLKHTKGDHLKSISTRRVASTPVDAQTAATQAVKGEQAISPNTGVQNVLTDNQVRRLGSAGPTRTTELLQEINDGMKIDVSELAAEANMSELEVVQDAAAKLGDDFGFTPADVSKLDLNEEGYLSRTGIVQSRMVMQEMSSRLARAVFKANDASARGMNNLEHVQDMVDTLKAFMKTYKVSANLNSKRLSAGGIELPKEFGVQGDALKNLYSPDSAGIDKAFEASEKMLDKMVSGLKGNNPKARQQALQIGAQLELMGDQPFKLAQGISTLQEVGTKLALKIMYNSMLSSPATHIVNSVSNAVAVVMRPLSAAAGGDIRSRKAAAASFYSLGETLSDALEMASRKWQTQTENVKGTDVSTGEASMALDELELRAAESGDARLQTGVTVLRMIQGIADYPLFDWPSKALTTADEFFKTAVQRMEYKRMIMEEAIDLHGNDAEAAFKHLYEKEKGLNFTKSGESLNKELNRVAKEVTFQQDLEGPAKRFGEWVESFPALRVFFPFVRTGHNVANYTASYVPVLAQAMERLGDTKFADLPPYEQAIIRGRQRIGAGFIAATGLMAANGMITGNGPMDPDARKRWLEQNQPRSLKIGDVFISLDRIEPFGPILSAVADIHYAVSEGTMKPDRAEWMVGYLTQAIAVNITDRTFFQGFQDMAKFISPRGGGTGERMAAFFADTANNLIPAAGLRRTLTNMFNPYMQEFNNQWDRTLHSATGGLLGDTATRYDFITGEPVGSMSGGINSLLPIKINQKKQDPVKQALFDIEYNSDRIVEELGRTGLKLTPEQISKLQQYMGSSDLHKELKRIVTAPDWQAAVKRYRERVAGGYRVAKESQLFYKEIHDKISIYADDAMSRLKREYPELDEALTDYQKDAAADRYGGLTEFYQQ